MNLHVSFENSSTTDFHRTRERLRQRYGLVCIFWSRTFIRQGTVTDQSEMNIPTKSGKQVHFFLFKSSTLLCSAKSGKLLTSDGNTVDTWQRFFWCIFLDSHTLLTIMLLTLSSASWLRPYKHKTKILVDIGNSKDQSTLWFHSLQTDLSESFN